MVEQTEIANPITKTVREFYEERPFPGYETFDSVSSLIQRAEQGQLARWLDEQLQPRIVILDAGCGTGQLATYLSLSNRRVFGVDLCFNSLQKAKDFRRRFSLSYLHFCEMDLLRPALRRDFFDCVLSMGVLHHTPDPRSGFHNLVKVLKPGGYFILGLYNRYGRLGMRWRRFLLHRTGLRAKKIDPLLKKEMRGGDKEEAWLYDQYFHPHETVHTVKEVLRWFQEEGLTYLSSMPDIAIFNEGQEHPQLFSKNRLGSPFEHLLAQISWIFSLNAQGGLFILIGQKPV